MSAADQYRTSAAKFRALARLESRPRARGEYEQLARAYLRLAEQADRNDRLDISYETPPLPDLPPA